jgi:hypothetical protein
MKPKGTVEQKETKATKDSEPGKCRQGSDLHPYPPAAGRLWRRGQRSEIKDQKKFQKRRNRQAISFRKMLAANC